MEQPITITQACVRAVLAGRKSQLRYAVAEATGLCPLGQAGDRLWVREIWAAREVGNKEQIIYEADVADTAIGPIEWQSSKSMLRNDSRLLLEITTVKLQRIQEIADAEILAEGGMWHENAPVTGIPETEREGFARWWSRVHAKSGFTWEANPLVWAVGFRRL